MKKVTLLFFALGIFSASINGQDVYKEIDKKYKNEGHKAFLYQVSPQIKQGDEWLIEWYNANEQVNSVEQLAITDLSTDTTWGYSEYKALGDTINQPSEFNRYFNIGTTAKHTRYYNNYSWFPDSAKWLPERLQTTMSDSLKGDSTETLYYRHGETEPYTGTRNIAPLPPTDGADYESYYEYYDPETGWVKESRTLSYRDENGSDTLRTEYYYNDELMEYEIGTLQRYRSSEDYYLYYYESYLQGQLRSSDKQEQTPDFELRERKSFDEGVHNRGTYQYLKKGDDQRYIYQVSKEYDAEKMSYIGQDSLHFNYLNDDTITEAIGYTWDDSVWVLSQSYNSYQSEIATGDVVADSVLIFKIVFNEETMSYEKGRVQTKTEMDYDEFGNQIEVRGYQLIDEELTLVSRTVREFKKLTDYRGEPYYTTVKEELYGRDFISGELYFSSVTETKYDNEGVYIGNSNFRFNATGDTTYGYATQRELTGDRATVEVRFDWDLNAQELLLSSYRIYGRVTTGDMGQNFTQTLNATITNGEQSFNRGLNVYTSYPGIFNDGPIYIELGDTLIHYVSAMNPDMTIPDVEVTNMPASATYDSESRRFFWVVDEIDPSPMTYKAIRGDKFVTTEVEFISEQFAVGTEDESRPNEFRLSQNYPNPFNPSTNISFNLPSSGEVSLKVYNLLGQEVAALVNGRMSSGTHTVTFDASQLSSGMYIYRLQAGNYLQTKKMMLIK